MLQVLASVLLGLSLAPETLALGSTRSDSEIEVDAQLDAVIEALAVAELEALANSEANSEAAPLVVGVADGGGGGGGEDVVEVQLENPAAPFEILDTKIEPGTVTRLALHSSEAFSGTQLETPIVVVHGLEAGPSLCIIAGIHGDEVNGVEVVRRTLASLSPTTLRGTLIAVPIANVAAFRRGSRYLPDRRDLNRYFPGRSRGSSASRIAHSLFNDLVRKCDSVVDLHTGSFHRANLHQLRANLSHEGTRSLAAAFGADVVVNNAGKPGTLRRAATDQGIPAITIEAGEPARFDEDHVVEGLAGIRRLLEARNMIGLPEQQMVPQPTTIAYLRTRWVRCDHGGILVSKVQLGDALETGQILGTISDPLSDHVETLVAPQPGRLIGMALDQVVMPGFAAYHIGFDARAIDSNVKAMHSDSDTTMVSDPEGLDLEERPE